MSSRYVDEVAQKGFKTVHAGDKRPKEEISVDVYFEDENPSTRDAKKGKFIEVDSPVSYGGAGFSPSSPAPEEREAFDKAQLEKIIQMPLKTYYLNADARLPKEHLAALKKTCHRELSDIIRRELQNGYDSSFLYTILINSYHSLSGKTVSDLSPEEKLKARSYTDSIFRRAHCQKILIKIKELFSDLSAIHPFQTNPKSEFHKFFAEKNYQDTLNFISEQIRELFKLSYTATEIQAVTQAMGREYFEKTRPHLTSDEVDTLSNELAKKLISEGRPKIEFPSPYSKRQS